MSTVRSAVVVGGGVAGPVTAMALRKAGIEPTVLEARPAGAEDRGVFLTLAGNGIEALRVLEADRPVLAAGFPTPALTLRSGTGKRLGETAIGVPLRDGTTSRTLRRADLVRALHDEAASRGIRVERGRRVVGAVEDSAGVTAVLDDGSEVRGAVLVGADGVWSTVRRVIDPDAPAPRYQGLVGTGGYARGVAVDAEPGRFEMVFGRRAFFGYVVAPDGEAWWFANVPRPDEPARGELAAVSAQAWRARLLDLFADDAGPATALIEATPELEPMSALHAVPRLPRWRRGRMVVVGDAAHAPSPTSGQGASLAIEDAVVLATCLRDHPTVPSALARFEALRRPRVERIVRWAQRMNANKAAGPVGRVIRDAVLPLVLRAPGAAKAQRSMFEHRVEWEPRTA